MSAILGWTLIMVMSGWGAGVGSKGNTIAVATFQSESLCQSAADTFKRNVAASHTYHNNEGIVAFCAKNSEDRSAKK